MFARRSKRDLPAAESTLVFGIQGMHCASCGLTIDEAVEDIPGVARARTSFRSGTTEVTLTEVTEKHHVTGLITAAISNVGYVVSPPPA